MLKAPQLLSKSKSGRPAKHPGNRLLVTVTIHGSPSHLRFEDQPAGAVIGIALESYARQGRLPALGTDSDGFLLCWTVNTLETIGSLGSRDFVLCKKPKTAPFELCEPSEGEGCGGRDGSTSLWVFS